jgi:hypothetical protein
MSSTPITPSPGQAVSLLDAAIAETRRLGRPDLAERLTAQREEAVSGAWHVLVAGEFKKGKSAFVNALLGVPVCGADAVAFTAVPTIVRYGKTHGAELVLDGDESRRRAVPVQAAASYGLRGTDDSGNRLQAIEVQLPRELLRSGLVVVDTPGLGGGFAAAQAAATMRAMSLAHAVLVISDASQEYTASEVEFIRHATGICPRLICVLTKTDFYPEWRRILDINRGHLKRAGLEVEIVPVSTPLREQATATGDRALNSESGFPTVVDRLRTMRSSVRTEVAERQAAAVRNALAQVSEMLSTEHAALTRPEERPATIRRLDEAKVKAEQLSGASSRWLNIINDRFADIQAKLDADLQERVRRLEEDAGRRISEGDPTREWAEIVPWLQQRTNEELLDCHTRTMRLIDEVAQEVAALFAIESADVSALTAGRTAATASETFRLERLAARNAGRLEIGMQAARGWSLSSSVVTTLLIATLHPGLLIALPVTALLGSVFAIKAVRAFKTARIEAARGEAVRAVAMYLHQARADAARSSTSLLRHSRSQLRDFYLDRAHELVATAEQGRRATVQAAGTDTDTARQRAAETAQDLSRVHMLLDAAGRGVPR